MERHIDDHFAAHAELLERSRRVLGAPVAAAARALIGCLRAGGKVLACGNGGSAADAQHFAAELVVQYHRRRRALPAVALTTDTSVLTAAANDLGYAAVFERQVEALGRPGDALVGISTSGESENVLRACGRALELGLVVVALAGETGGRLAGLLEPACADGRAHLVRVPARRADEIQQIHILVLHLFCELIEREVAP